MDESPSMFARIFDLDGGKGKRPPPKKEPAAEDVHSHSHGKDHKEGSHGNDHGHGHGTEAAPVPPVHSTGAEAPIVFGGGGGGGIPVMEGGGAAVDILSMFQRLGILFLIVIVSIALATYFMTTPVFYKRFFNPESDDDANFESADATHDSRYKKLAKVLLVFHIMIFICFILVLFVLYLLFAVYYEVMGISKQPGAIPLLDFFKDFLLNYDNFGTKMSLSDFYLAAVVILVVGYLFYLFYFKYVLGYFTNLTFPAYIDTEVSSEPEWENPKKYLIMYGLMLLYILAFAIMVMNYIYGFKSKILFIWNTIFLFLLMFFLGFVYKYAFKKDVMKVLVWFVVLVILCFSNKTLGGAFKFVIDNMMALGRMSK